MLAAASLAEICSTIWSSSRATPGAGREDSDPRLLVLETSGPIGAGGRIRGT